MTGPQTTIAGEPSLEVQERRQSALRKALVKRGLRNTRQREILTEIFFASNEHFNLEELLNLAREKDGGIGYATVYRTLKLLTELGLAHELHFSEGQTRYEAADGVHHDHLICVRCRAIVEFEEDRIEDLQQSVAREHGFQLLHHRMELYGLCAKCSADDPENGAEDG